MGNACSGGCCGEEQMKVAKLENRSSVNKDRRSKKAGAAAGETSAFRDFKDEINENQDQDLWTVVDNFPEDGNRDDDADDEEEISLKRSGKTKKLFKRKIMDVVVRFVGRKVKDTFLENGPFEYRYALI
jgi:hypothetical protein